MKNLARREASTRKITSEAEIEESRKDRLREPVLYQFLRAYNLISLSHLHLNIYFFSVCQLVYATLSRLFKTTISS
jgi:hypothetical protein